MWFNRERTMKKMNEKRIRLNFLHEVTYVYCLWRKVKITMEWITMANWIRGIFLYEKFERISENLIFFPRYKSLIVIVASLSFSSNLTLDSDELSKDEFEKEKKMIQHVNRTITCWWM